MNFISVLAALALMTGLVADTGTVVYHTAWHTRGPAVVQDRAHGVWTIEKQVIESTTPPPQREANDSLGVDITARSAVVVDRATGAILWEKNQEEVRAIGSITKLMTALVFIDHNPGWQEVIEVLPQDRTFGGRQHLYPGDDITLRDVFNVALIASDNDAAMILARSTGLSTEEFVEAMNQKAAFLGLARTRFSDPTGLSDTNVSTAGEVIKLATTAFRNDDILNVANQERYEFTSREGREYSITSTNKLLGSFLNIAAAKTGFINKAGYCIVAEVEQDGQEILVAILGSETDPDRFHDLKMLSYWTWDNYMWGA